MEFISAEQLQEQDIDTSIKNNSTISWQGKLYQRTKVLSKSYREQALSIYQENLESNLNTLLVEYKNYLAVWVEKKLEPDRLPEKSLTPKSLPPKSKKTVTRQYRGVSYEVEIPDFEFVSSKMSPSKSGDKATRQYRGQSY